MSCTVKSHPRIPEQDATEAIFLCSLHHDISIHAPLMGCDARADSSGNTHYISIHAPLTGCDNALDCFETYCLDFNPRTPYGMRHTVLRHVLPFFLFQSTHPLRDATVFVGASVPSNDISIHAPLTGCDKTLATFFATPKAISIHAPLTGCDLGDIYNAIHAIQISIHAPLTGCDHKWFMLFKIGLTISIHAPLTGCDRVTISKQTTILTFQSTHPLRDATMM